MDTDSEHPDIGFWRGLVQAGTRTRFAPGVIGRSSVIIISTIALWALVVWRMSPTHPWWFDLLLGAVGAVATMFASRQLAFLRTFAEKNPSLALTEGADVIKMRRIEAQAKAHGPDLSPVVAGASMTSSAPVKIIRSPDGQILPQEPTPVQPAIADTDAELAQRLKP
jgi:hypothetical protein